MEYNDSFDEYVEMIVNHPNYKGLFFDRSKDGKVNWVTAGKSEKGMLRLEWWNKTCLKLGIPIQKGCYAIAARAIHPTKKHVCQCCGRELSIRYEYPSSRILKKINSILCTDIEQVDYTIKEIILKFVSNTSDLTELAKLFRLNDIEDKKQLIDSIYKLYVETESNLLSPGVMSNCPDRFDGFHSYGLCCRKNKDKGRHDENMKTYSQDRRAYEEWSDGNYNLANRLMGEFHKVGPMKCPICGKMDTMTADHIGPISLGFCHSVHFAPMCRNCNSSKNNRFTLSDVKDLIALEQKGEKVISWHSKYIWNKLKFLIVDDKSAKKASSIMAKCHQNILYLFSLIYEATGTAFLIRYLHPEYSLYDYRFQNLDLRDLSSLKIVESPINSKNKRSNQNRYIRIAFDSLKDFGEKKNRRTYYLFQVDSPEFLSLISDINNHNYTKADQRLLDIIKHLSEQIFGLEWSNYSVDDSNHLDFAAEPD